MDKNTVQMKDLYFLVKIDIIEKNNPIKYNFFIKIIKKCMNESPLINFLINLILHKFIYF